MFKAKRDSDRKAVKMFASLAVSFASFAMPVAAEATPRPGPNLALFNNPYYSCSKNYYVSLGGSDANSGTSMSAPWLTLQHANDVLPVGGSAAGTCINAAPGVYAHGVDITAGGGAAASNGYVVYRCMQMDACTITDVSAGGQNGAFVWNSHQPMTGNYVIVDGFTLKASAATTFGQGVQILNGTNTWLPSVHHVWIMNSIVSGYGESGLQMNHGEYFFVIHNKIFGNSSVGCGAQGSGISFNELKALNAYTRTPDDSFNKVVGNIGTQFHNVVEMNVVYNNAITQCGNTNSPYDTDGNNITMDTLNWDNQSGTIPYSAGVLIAFNVVYNGGGGGIHLATSEYVTVANNSCYNSWLDPYNNGSGRGCLDSVNSYANNFFNNISVAIPAPHATCAYNVPPYAMWNSAFVGSPPSPAYTPDTFNNNISYLIGSSCQPANAMFNGDSFSCSNNKCSTDPSWSAVGTNTAGTETVPPVAANFALKSGSPAIGYGLTASYLPKSSIDIGACGRDHAQCP